MLLSYVHWLKSILRYCIIDDVHHTDQETEESAVNEAAEKLLAFDLPAEPSHDDGNEHPQIGYVKCKRKVAPRYIVRCIEFAHGVGLQF